MQKKLDHKGIKWIYESARFKYTFEGVDRYYVPDFYIPLYDLYVELHSTHFWSDQMDAKLKSVENIMAIKSHEALDSFIGSLPNNFQTSEVTKNEYI